MKASPKQLKKLFEHTHQVLRLYYNKEKWPVIFPSITQLAERFVQCYSQQPGALHAHLHFYAKHQGYTTNLVVNQCILVTAMCQALKFNKELTESLVIAAISDQICTSNETNKLAAGQPLSEQAQRLVQNRHALAVKMLNKGNVPTGQIQRVLARLNKYASAITGINAVPLYDNPSIIVAIAMRIAKAITPRPKIKTFSINQAIKSLYLSCYNEFAQNALAELGAQLVNYPSGLSVTYKNEQCLVVTKHENIHYLALIIENQARRIIRTSQPILGEYRTQIIDDPILLYKIWFNEQLPVLSTKPDDVSNNFDKIAKLGNTKYPDFKQLEKVISDSEHIEHALRTATKQYNRQAQKAGSLRHSLTMVGLDTAALLCQRVLLETMISNVPHPFSIDIINKYAHINKVITLLISKKHSEKFEFYLCPFAAFIYFLLEHHSEKLMRFIQTPEDEFSSKPVSIAHLFGLKDIQDDSLSEYIENYFSESFSHRALLNTEIKTKSQLNDVDKEFVAIKYLVISSLYDIDIATPWQKQITSDVLQYFEWSSIDAFNSALLELSPQCVIE
ncbi:hypothetical protein [Pseudoalteromonas phenolica]|uniref:Uncharacterized protein n=2 Tax=Pseudoalteromonas phenolica TaxID=161398 RepID=A0A0S2K8T4_9GAMM|nr:hypothetical protein [Pseudoalteromonas phenolica]ALO44648.1 hypothetical protein PP2015_4181 [Pseudoalteromonas phenolica]MBE0357682.1 hypothetical protein [Pseudoalteromonas phenolica O-BC30]TMO55687.1 hypothetical protein CWC21_09585 [Pseudoalteromonas phenolica]